MRVPKGITVPRSPRRVQKCLGVPQCKRRCILAASYPLQEILSKHGGGLLCSVSFATARPLFSLVGVKTIASNRFKGRKGTLMDDLKALVRDLDAMIANAEMVETTGKFYSDDCVFQEGNKPPRTGGRSATRSI